MRPHKCSSASSSNPSAASAAASSSPASPSCSEPPPSPPCSPSPPPSATASTPSSPSTAPTSSSPPRPQPSPSTSAASTSSPRQRLPPRVRPRQTPHHLLGQQHHRHLPRALATLYLPPTTLPTARTPGAPSSAQLNAAKGGPSFAEATDLPQPHPGDPQPVASGSDHNLRRPQHRRSSRPPALEARPGSGPRHLPTSRSRHRPRRRGSTSTSATPSRRSRSS